MIGCICQDRLNTTTHNSRYQWLNSNKGVFTYSSQGLMWSERGRGAFSFRDPDLFNLIIPPSSTHGL